MIDTTYNVNIERAVLSSFLFGYDGFDEVCNFLKAEDFYFPAHKYIYEAMQKLHNENMPLDEEFLRKKINSKDVDDSILIEIMCANPITNVEAYISEIKESSKKRKIASLATLIKKETIEEDNHSSDIIAKIKLELDSLESEAEIIEETNGQDILEMHFENVPLYMTGIEPIDEEIEGIKNGQLIYVTGLEETGKTHITYKIMENISYSRNVGIISLEFGKEKLKDRLASMIKSGHKLTPKNIKASFNCHNINNLEKTIKKWANDGCKFFVIDSINLIENHTIKDRFEKVLNIGTRLFKLVQQLEITMFVISTSTKDDNKNGNPSIYGGQLLNNYCDQKWHIFRDFETEERLLWINKNKQNYKYPKIPLKFTKGGDIISNNILGSKVPVIIEFKNEKINNEENLDSSFDIESILMMAD